MRNSIKSSSCTHIKCITFPYTGEMQGDAGRSSAERDCARHEGRMT